MVGSSKTYIQRGFQGFIGVPLILVNRPKGRQGKGLKDRSLSRALDLVDNVWAMGDDGEDFNQRILDGTQKA